MAFVIVGGGTSSVHDRCEALWWTYLSVRCAVLRLSNPSRPISDSRGQIAWRSGCTDVVCYFAIVIS